MNPAQFQPRVLEEAQDATNLCWSAEFLAILPAISMSFVEIASLAFCNALRTVITSQPDGTTLEHPWLRSTKTCTVCPGAVPLLE